MTGQRSGRLARRPFRRTSRLGTTGFGVCPVCQDVFLLAFDPDSLAAYRQLVVRAAPGQFTFAYTCEEHGLQHVFQQVHPSRPERRRGAAPVRRFPTHG